MKTEDIKNYVLKKEVTYDPDLRLLSSIIEKKPKIVSGYKMLNETIYVYED